MRKTLIFALAVLASGCLLAQEHPGGGGAASETEKISEAYCFNMSVVFEKDNCYYDKAVQNTDSRECQWISQDYFRDLCYRNVKRIGNGLQPCTMPYEDSLKIRCPETVMDFEGKSLSCRYMDILNYLKKADVEVTLMDCETAKRNIALAEKEIKNCLSEASMMEKDAKKQEKNLTNTMMRYYWSIVDYGERVELECISDSDESDRRLAWFLGQREHAKQNYEKAMTHINRYVRLSEKMDVYPDIWRGKRYLEEIQNESNEKG